METEVPVIKDELKEKIQIDIDKDVDTIFDTLKRLAEMRQQKYGDVNIALYCIAVLADTLAQAGFIDEEDEEETSELQSDFIKMELGINAIMEELPASLSRMAYAISDVYSEAFVDNIKKQKQNAN